MIQKPKHAIYEHISIYDLPPDQRATFYLWAMNTKTLVKLHTPSKKSDWYGIVDGAKWDDYVNWYTSVWDGRVYFPSITHNGTSFSPHTCDRLLFDENGNPNTDVDKEIISIKDSLIGTMLYPFRHDTFSQKIDGKIWTWYELENHLEELWDLMDVKPNAYSLFKKMQTLARNATDAVLEARYNYINKYYN